MDDKLIIASQSEIKAEEANVTAEVISIDEIALREEKSCWCLCEYNT